MKPYLAILISLFIFNTDWIGSNPNADDRVKTSISSNFGSDAEDKLGNEQQQITSYYLTNSYLCTNFMSDVEKIASKEATLLIHDTQILGANVVVPENVTLKFLKGGLIDGGFKLEIKGALEAGRWQIFGKAITVQGHPKVDAVFPEWFGAVANGNTDCVKAFNAALIFAKTGRVLLSQGTYLLNTDTGSVVIPESTELAGVGGIPVRRPLIASQGTKIHVRGKTNSAFLYHRGIKVHDLFIDYPDQKEDPVTPLTYPACFDRGDSSGSKSFFSNLIFDRCFSGFRSSGGTFWNNVHGSFYFSFIKIEKSSALSVIENCSVTSLWHIGKSKNTLAFQQENLTVFTVDKGADALSISDTTIFTAKNLLLLINGDSLNFCKLDNVMCDGVISPLNSDGSVLVLMLHFSNCGFRLNNEHGSKHSISSINIDSASKSRYADRSIIFSGCRFRVAPNGVISVDNGGIDRLIINGCQFFDWNKQGNSTEKAKAAIYINDSNCNLTVTNCHFDSRNRFGEQALNVNNAGSVIFSSNTMSELSTGIYTAPKGLIKRLTVALNTAMKIKTPISNNASVVGEVVEHNNW